MMKRYLVFALETIGEKSDSVKAAAVYLCNADTLENTKKIAVTRYNEMNPQGVCEIFTVAEPFDITLPVKSTTPGVDLVPDHAPAPEGQTHDAETQTVGQYGVTNKPHN